NSGRRQEAEESALKCVRWLEALIVARPERAGFYRVHLAWLLVGRPGVPRGDGRRALELLGQEPPPPPLHADWWTCRGVASYRAHDWAGAAQSFEEALRLRPRGNARAELFLALCHWRQGNHERARRYYNLAVGRMAHVQMNMAELLRFQAEAEAVMEAKQR